MIFNRWKEGGVTGALNTLGGIPASGVLPYWFTS
jgi:hypothetical protein